MSKQNGLKLLLVATVFLFIALSAGAEPRVLALWSFEDGGGNSVEGAPAARVEGAKPVEGHQGKGLSFEDWSTKNYLHPDPTQATRVIVPHDDRLNPEAGFRVTAWIYPTADPVYYGGIVEKGRGFGASYRLLLVRGLKLEASAGEQHVSVKSETPLSLATWHEVSLSVDKTSLTLEIDGKEAGRASLPTGFRAKSDAPLVIGERFTGRIDEVEISSQ